VGVKIVEHAGEWAEPDHTGATYVEHFATSDLSVGTYSLRVGAVDTQEPHTEDEVYVVIDGRAGFTGGEQTVEVGPGTVLFSGELISRAVTPARASGRRHER
jgi:mannose-6-phosphate isomerase-like protein (cupin superfamily)